MSTIEVSEGWFSHDRDSGPHSFDYDLIVIGGGSGGLASAREAAKLGKRAVVFDWVAPSPAGSKWGLGGTCVNVGCIPKKLMHNAALLGESLHDAASYGWDLPPQPLFAWEKLVSGVQDHIGSLNWGYRTNLRSEGVEYINAEARFEDAHTVIGKDRKGKETKVTGRRIIIAVGGRPKYPEIPGAQELGITSDDLFSLMTAPGKTLCVGGSYVALECAGFLTGLGFETTVMVRSILLRGFDQQMADQIGAYMEAHKTRFIRGSIPTRLEKVEDPTSPKGFRIKVWYRGDDPMEHSEIFDTVLFAVGREPCTRNIHPDKAGVHLLQSGKIKGDNERTNVPHIYAIGDNLEGHLELTPVAIATGRRLVRRLYQEGYKLGIVNRVIPTTVFTPLEYGCVGLSEEDATRDYPNIDVVHTNYQPLEWTVSHRENNACYLKLIYNKDDCNRIIGFHLLGPNAGEITQGFAIAMATGKGVTLEEVQRTIGIHPTSAEEVTGAVVTKSSGEDTAKSGC